MFPFPFSFVAPTAGGLADIDNVYSMEFDGVDDYFSINSSGALDTFHQNPFSISFWFKTSSGSVQVLADKSTTSSGSTRAFYIYMQSGVIYWYGATASPSYANGSYSDGNWHHAVFVAESDTVARIYVDGVDDTNNIAKDRIGGLTVTAPIILGAAFTTTQFFLNGSMDEFAVFDYALDSGQVDEIYNATSSGKTADLSSMATPPIAWYRMGD